MPRRKKSDKKKSPIAVSVIAVAIVVLFLCACTRSMSRSIRHNFFRDGINGPLFTGLSLTPLGSDLLSASSYLALSLAGIFVLIGFLRLRRWSWVLLMAWTGISLVISLVDYFYSHANYAVMASNVIIAFALNIPNVQRIFGIRKDTDAPEVTDRPTAPVGTPDLELLRKFEPVVYYTRGEQVYPAQVEPYVADSALWEHHPDGHDELLVKHGQMTMEKLIEPRPAAFGSIRYLRFVEPLNLGEAAQVLADQAALRRQIGELFPPRHRPAGTRRLPAAPGGWAVLALVPAARQSRPRRTWRRPSWTTTPSGRNTRSTSITDG